MGSPMVPRATGGVGAPVRPPLGRAESWKAVIGMGAPTPSGRQGSVRFTPPPPPTPTAAPGAPASSGGTRPAPMLSSGARSGSGSMDAPRASEDASVCTSEVVVLPTGWAGSLTSPSGAGGALPVQRSASITAAAALDDDTDEPVGTTAEAKPLPPTTLRSGAGAPAMGLAVIEEEAQGSARAEDAAAAEAPPATWTGASAAAAAAAPATTATASAAEQPPRFHAQRPAPLATAAGEVEGHESAADDSTLRQTPAAQTGTATSGPTSGNTPGGASANVQQLAAPTSHDLVPRKLKDSTVILMMTILKLVYLQCSQYAMMFFDCTRVGSSPPVYVFDADTSLRCDANYLLSWQYEALGIVCLVAYVLGVPLVMTGFLGWRPLWATCSRCKELAPTARGPSETALEMGKDYRREMWFWDLCILARKLLILVPQVFSSAYTEFQAVFVSMVLVVALIAQIVCRPYREPLFNNLEVAALSCATLVVHLGLLFRAVDSAGAAGTLFGTFCVIIIALTIATFSCVAINILCAFARVASRHAPPPLWCLFVCAYMCECGACECFGERLTLAARAQTRSGGWLGQIGQKPKTPPSS